MPGLFRILYELLLSADRAVKQGFGQRSVHADDKFNGVLNAQSNGLGKVRFEGAVAV